MAQSTCVLHAEDLGSIPQPTWSSEYALPNQNKPVGEGLRVNSDNINIRPVFCITKPIKIVMSKKKK